jgi:hypothetical protein
MTFYSKLQYKSTKADAPLAVEFLHLIYKTGYRLSVIFIVEKILN